MIQILLFLKLEKKQIITLKKIQQKNEKFIELKYWNLKEKLQILDREFKTSDGESTEETI